MDAKLKECPHCGSQAQLDDCRTIWRVICTSAACGALVLGDRAPEPDGEMGDAYWIGIKQTAIDRWNARAIAPPVAANWRVFSKSNQIKFSIGVQTFTLAYEPENQEEIDFMAKQLTIALSKIDSAPPVAAGSVDTEELISGLRRQYKRALDSALYEQQRAEKAEANLVEARAEIETRKASILFWIDRVNGLEADLAAAKRYDLKA